MGNQESAASPSSYVLSVDLGTTFTAAAIGRIGSDDDPPAGSGHDVEIMTLGSSAAAVPSVVVLREDGDVLVGEAGERRALAEPTRAAREFKRRLGDPIPLLLGGTPYGAEALMGHVLAAVVREVSQREGGPPQLIVLTHPASWAQFKRDFLLQAARLAGLDPDQVQLLTEPEAAAIHYAARDRLTPGDVVAVYDFGGGTFDSAVLIASEHGFTLAGRPEGIERIGGIDIDRAVLAHVEEATGLDLAELDASDPAVRNALQRLREDCRAAKETLSGDTDAAIPVFLPGLSTQVRITRSELESMIRPRVAETVAALERSVRSAGRQFGDLSRVLLVGGSSRIPLVAQMVREATGRPVALDAHPKHAIALGAAAWGCRSLAAAAHRAAPAPGSAAAAVAPLVAASHPPVATADHAEREMREVREVRGAQPAPTLPLEDGRKRKPTVLVAAAAALSLVGGGAVALRSGSAPAESALRTSPVTILSTVSSSTVSSSTVPILTTVPIPTTPIPTISVPANPPTSGLRTPSSATPSFTPSSAPVPTRLAPTRPATTEFATTRPARPPATRPAPPPSVIVITVPVPVSVPERTVATNWPVAETAARARPVTPPPATRFTRTRTPTSAARRGASVARTTPAPLPPATPPNPPPSVETSAPTTAVPTTATPATAPPPTVPSTTAPPTTAPPATAPPTTTPPTTAPPTTLLPTTAPPTTLPPTTAPPTTEPPTTTVAPTTAATTSSVPVISAPPVSGTALAGGSPLSADPLRSVADATGILTAPVPSRFAQVDTSPKSLDGVDAVHISAATDLARYYAGDFTVTGMTLLGADEAEAGTPEQLVAFFAPIGACTRTPGVAAYRGRFLGVSQRWDGCGNGATGQILAAVRPLPGKVLVVGITAGSSEDAAVVLDKVLNGLIIRL